MTGSARRGTLLNGSTLIEFNGQRFLITERPKERNLQSYLNDLQVNRVSDLVRVCEPSYPTNDLVSAGIEVHDWSFDDGSSPPKAVLDHWLSLIHSCFVEKPDSCIAVHCVAGLGRAPVLVAVALIEGGMRYEDAISHIRSKRHGAFNTKQIMYLEAYKPSKRKKGGEPCVVM